MGQSSWKIWSITTAPCYFCSFRLVGYEGLEVINPEGGTEDAEEEAQRGRWKQEVHHLLFRSLWSIVYIWFYLPQLPYTFFCFFNSRILKSNEHCNLTGCYIFQDPMCCVRITPFFLLLMEESNSCTLTHTPMSLTSCVIILNIYLQHTKKQLHNHLTAHYSNSWIDLEAIKLE